MAENPYALPQETAQRLMADVQSRDPERLRHEITVVCDADPRDHLHVGAVGDPGSGLEARGLIVSHEGGRVSRVFVAAPRLRQLASALLNVADEIDGKTPLVFFPPGAPDAEEPQG